MTHDRLPRPVKPVYSHALKTMKKLLVFAPHSAIWPHTYPEALVLDSLRQSGLEIHYVTCNRTFAKHCICMIAAQVPVTADAATRESICVKCVSNANLVKNHFSFKTTSLQNHLTDADRALAKNTAAQSTLKQLLEYELETVPVGKLALYELLLQHKKSNFDFNDEQNLQFRASIEHCILTLLAMKKLMQAISPEYFAVYNSLYSVNAVARVIAKKFGSEAYFLHAGPDLSRPYQTMMLGYETPFVRGDLILKLWPSIRNTPLTDSSFEKVASSFMETFKGKSIYVYSSGKSAQSENIYTRFGLDPNKKVCVAAMSSTDERFAAESSLVVEKKDNLLFADQFEWIKALIEYFATRDDLSLIIRIHPREFPNKRDSVLSPNAVAIKALFEKLPPNVKVNWPSDQVSLYDLAEETDLFLSAWSSVGTEMPLLGIPVLTYATPYLYYPPELNDYASSVEEYFKKIPELAKQDIDFEKVRLLFRWLSIIISNSMINLEDGVRPLSTSFLSRAYRKIRRSMDPLYQEKRDIRKKPNHIHDAKTAFSSLSPTLDWVLTNYSKFKADHQSLKKETRIVQQQLERIRSVMHGGTVRNTKYHRRISKISSLFDTK